MGVGNASRCLLFSSDQMLGAQTKEEGYEPTRNGIVFVRNITTRTSDQLDRTGLPPF
jgi:hypothetical protein